MEKRKVLVITGGIGAGKSYVSARFAVRGIPVYDSDSRTKMLYDTDPVLLSGIAGLVGSDVIGSDGRLDRGLMAERIFSSPGLLAEVESLVFPRVIDDFVRWKDSMEAPVVIMESAIFLMKPLLYPVADKVLYVDAPEEIRVRRVMKRDCVSRDKVLARISNQKDCSHMADWIIDTSEGDSRIDEKVTLVLGQMLGKS